MEKLKSFLQNDQLFYGLIILLVGFASFLLGRQSVLQNKPLFESNRVTIEQAAAISGLEVSSRALESDSTLSLVASKSGSKFHLDSCPGASQIKTENKIYFKSVKEAEAAGYTPAANCPGLK